MLFMDNQIFRFSVKYVALDMPCFLIIEYFNFWKFWVIVIKTSQK